MKTIDVALSQVGIKEATGQNDGVPAERYNHGEKAPWCAALLIWCINASDDRHIGKKEEWDWRSVQAFEDGMKALGLWVSPDTLPLSNYLVFFAGRDKSDPGKGRHMGIVEKVEKTEKGLVLHTVEGNYGNAVSKVQRPLYDAASRSQITGYGRL